ncbi:hypothetical protein [Ruminococcus sp.]|uniref:hypothetical protein n=1 Tax=Ruminococcus sp. TaxID=41978 RepID=UPI0025E4A6B0|nr:hypothetical protein [Ruminococcus sp.]MCI5816937.1 hypothetical protein [Ruminococcus sp.]
MNRFFDSPWTKRILSLVTIPYGIFLGYVAYWSVFYDIEIYEKVKFGFVLAIGCLAMGIMMFYTRRQLVTMVVSIVTMPLLLPIVLLNFGEWELLIPLVLVSVTAFFTSGSGEAAKTIFGAMILMLYMLGALAYFFYTTVLVSSVQMTPGPSGVSPSGNYRYEVTYSMDKCGGGTSVIVAPNTYDTSFSYMYCRAKGFDRTVYVTRPLSEPELKWTTEKRKDITATILGINPDAVLTLSESQMHTLGRDQGFTKEIRVKDLNQKQLKTLGIVLPASEGETEIPEGMRLYTEDTIVVDLSDLHNIGWTVSEDVPLSDLTDQQLAALGVPESGDVLYVNGEPQFRYYIAILDSYYDMSKRELVID